MKSVCTGKLLTSDVAGDLMISQKDCAAMLREIGCKTKVTTAAAGEEKEYQAALSAPVTFPKPRLGRK